MNPEKIRNFSIIAHIDHGKSTLSDRILEITHAVDERSRQDQQLDSLEIERERGITVKSAVITVYYKDKKGESWQLNLIDTPGHVDFNYEVSRSLAACEGAVLIIDASQGVEAQTISNFFLAFENDLEIVPCFNKIDLPSADIEESARQAEKEFGFLRDEIVAVSAKTGEGIEDLLEQIIKVIPPPVKSTDEISKEEKNHSLKALVFDSFFDVYRGAVICVRIFRGTIEPGDHVVFFHNQKTYTVEEVGLLGIEKKKTEILCNGEVGYVILGIKSVSEINTGDTLTSASAPVKTPLKGYKEVKPMVFAGIFPIDANEYNNLKDALEKLKLNDAALVYEKESSVALGFGFHAGFLGLLHMEIVQERLVREFGVSVILTAPGVTYRVRLKGSGNETYREINNPILFPDPSTIENIEEPYIEASIITPEIYLGSIIQLVNERRGIQKKVNWLDTKRVEAIFELPLSEVIFDFYDKLKSISKGYASFDYKITGYKSADITRVNILINKEQVDALSFLLHKDSARGRVLKILEKLKEEIPRHMFQIPLQAAIGATIIARENIPALRKDVTAKCYGGDISRKRKLLEKQKEGKKRMKSVGNVEIPQRAFVNILKS